MSKRAAEAEREMSLIWGNTGRAKQEKFDKAKEAAIAINKLGGTAANALAAPIRDEDEESNISFVSDNAGRDLHDGGVGASAAAAAAAGKKAKIKKAKVDAKYRLHTFIEPGTTRNDVREVFEGYGDPEVELRTSQKGNVLNKTHFAVVTFRNKALALWAASHLDGTNQRDRIGTNPMELSLFLSREQQKLVRRIRNKNKEAKKETTKKETSKKETSRKR